MTDTPSTASGLTPLLLSTIAGLSTCLGAAIVFCHPKAPNTNQRHVSPQMMAFSLSLAGSVMLTVSIVSIGPECLLNPVYEEVMSEMMSMQNGNSTTTTSSTTPTTPIAEEAKAEELLLQDVSKWLSPFSYLFFQRVINFVFGALLYVALRRMFPEPDEVEEQLLATLDHNINSNNSNNSNNKDSKKKGRKREEVDGSKEITMQLSTHSDVEAGDKTRQLRRRESQSKDDEEMLSLVQSASNGVADDTNTESKVKGKEEVYGASILERIKKGGGEAYKERLRLTRRQGNSGMGGGGNSGSPSSTRRSNQPQSKVSSPSRSQSLQSWASGEDLDTKDQRRAWRVAMLLFVSLMVHNFPEGLAVAASALEAEKLGIAVTIGIAIHNIPEGIAVAVPCLAARPDSPWLSFLLASISGLAEPAGAFVSLLFLRGFDKQSWFSLENVLAFVAGIMMTVAAIELYPESMRYKSQALNFIYLGSIAGFIIMVITELCI